jgi:hypothetical protein
MDFFQSGVFWIIEGILLCIVLTGLKIWFEDRRISMNFWKWGAVILWIVAFGVYIAFITTSLGENETPAALKGGILFGAILFLAALGLWFGIGRKKQHPENPDLHSDILSKE